MLHLTCRHKSPDPLQPSERKQALKNNYAKVTFDKTWTNWTFLQQLVVGEPPYIWRKQVAK